MSRDKVTVFQLESVMVVGEIKERLYISEPGGAYAIECDSSRTLRYLLVKLLTISSFLLSSSTNIANAARFIQKQIAKINERINSVIMPYLIWLSKGYGTER